VTHLPLGMSTSFASVDLAIRGFGVKHWPWPFGGRAPCGLRGPGLKSQDDIVSCRDWFASALAGGVDRIERLTVVRPRSIPVFADSIPSMVFKNTWAPSKFRALGRRSDLTTT